MTINKYNQDVSVNRAKNLKFPSLRGTWLPRIDHQFDGGVAINWLGIRARFKGNS